MLLLSLQANEFRNLSGRIEFDRALNIFAGPNGEGKTNWLEAIAVLASARSFRTARLGEAINFGSSEAVISGSVEESAEIVRRLGITIRENGKTLAVNGKKETTPNYLGQLNALVFEAGELDIVRGRPEARRRFLDAGIVSLHPPFVQTFSDYSRVLKQKNALLAASDTMSVDALRERIEPWNQQLVRLASRIHRARLRFVERLNADLEHRLFSSEDLQVRYLSSLEGKGSLSDYEGLLAERLELRLSAEAAAGNSLIGPHRDDLEMMLDGHDIRKYGSAGQQRSALLLLHLAAITVFYATRGEYPLYLLDDIDAELDYRRIGLLLEYLEGKTQVFLTTSKESFIVRFGAKAAVLKVAAGRAERLETKPR